VGEQNHPVDGTGRITIVIPVYGDWASLRDCVRSVFEHADPTQFDVLLVNDNGPDADEIEAGLRGLIYGHANVRYERNSANLGFVQTCNRAVYDLDRSGNDVLLLNSDARLTAGSLQEMRAVLELSPRHGVVCPRSNDATIASIPFFRRHPHEPGSAQRSIDVFSSTCSSLPRYYISPVAVGFCFLVRRSLIDRYGLFDEIFGKGYSEENDFCLRINAFGYSSLISNHAFVYHEGSSSFGPAERARLDEAHSAIVRERYPHYPASVVSFIQHDYTATDRFADLLTPDSSDSGRTVLIDLRDLKQPMCHEASVIVATITAIAHVVAATTEITVATRFHTIGNLEFSSLGIHTVDPDLIEQVFDVGITLSLTANPQQLTALNRYCLRWLIVVLDVPELRSWAARATNQAAHLVARLALKNADVVMWESANAQTEIEDFLAVNGRTGKMVLSTAGVAQELQCLLDPNSHEINLPRLESRSREVGDVALVDETARQQRETAALTLIMSSGSYRLSRKIAAIGLRLRGLSRR
jgi:GT2 family glycosyltransferase